MIAFLRTVLVISAAVGVTRLSFSEASSLSGSECITSKYDFHFEAHDQQLDLLPNEVSPRLEWPDGLSSIQDRLTSLKPSISASIQMSSTLLQLMNSVLSNQDTSLLSLTATNQIFELCLLSYPSKELDITTEAAPNLFTFETPLNSESTASGYCVQPTCVQPTCGLLCYHERLRSYLRHTVLSSLPETWANWITNNRLALGIICVTVMYGSLLWPLLFVLWRKMKSERRLIRELSLSNGACQTLESRVLALKKENSLLSEQLQRENAFFKETSISHSEQINREKALTEAKLSSVNDSFLAAQIEITQNQCLVMSLQEDIQDQCEEIMKLSSENSSLAAQVSELKDEKDRLRMKNDLIKRAKQTMMKCWTALLVKHQKTKKQLTATKEACAKMQSQLSSKAEELQLKDTTISKQERELKDLCDCRAHLMSEVQRELTVTKRKLEQYELLEFEAQEKHLIAKNEMDEERKEWKDFRNLLHAVFKSQTQQIQLHKIRAKDATKYAELTKQKLHLAKQGITLIKTRLIGSDVKASTTNLSNYTPKCPSTLFQANKSESVIQPKGEIRQRVPRLIPEEISPALGITCSPSSTGQSTVNSNVTPLYALDNEGTLNKREAVFLSQN